MLPSGLFCFSVTGWFISFINVKVGVYLILRIRLVPLILIISRFLRTRGDENWRALYTFLGRKWTNSLP